MLERFVERARVHDEACCDGCAEYDEQHEIEDVDDSADSQQSSKFMRLYRKQRRKATSAHRQGKPGPCETSKYVRMLLRSSKEVINTYCLNRSFNVISRSVPSGATSEIRLRACGLRCTTAFSKSFILVSRSPVELFVAVDPSLWWPSLSPAWLSRRRNAISGSDMIVSCLLRLLVLIYTAPR